ncbi:GntR family transcriptional regulator [Alkalihalobacillus alcalophilus ATCC 27647 = CGMCC 1.3604]|uniref:GntR family transcriptional regulator n=1 Tax=Alkalihalobacillus alcalophilus ATCC 27647 = CGMCC 1.3604 TaxID=1218173 RepID=A0A4S4K1I5_ALKAL|nr:GntR family transcriptional regulator [Alkalihalobacillus alcalophilus]MED1561310.1 GntR family transcriptional regulator [Alkalihalobacillus alcalophilus]THG91473.1 GntR family transcriptional regulator [Alkalihalobacillus alcalophilus ATCC 27647 = CGMCC 1.3604]
MIIDNDGSKPIYVQIAEWLETEIIKENFKVDEKIYSQYQLAEMLTINPATAAKGLNILADKGILYKKRGLGMFVTGEAKQFIMAERKEQTLRKLVHELVLEAYRLSVDEKEIMEMIQEMNKEIKGEKQ